MDTNIVLNFTTDSPSDYTIKSSKKGGRWTDRVKANRSAKRKERPATTSNVPAEEVSERPAKKPRLDSTPRTSTSVPQPQQSGPRPTIPTNRPIISSLFSYNPHIAPLSTLSSSVAPLSKPSNAPTSDATAFSGLGLDPLIITHLTSKMTITNPTSIQKAALPVILSEETKDRDVFIQSQTGSGKTLAFLLPIIQDLLPLSELSWIDRSIGTLAIIIAPTRELAKQISDVLESLLQLRLRPTSTDGIDNSSARLTRWLVSGLLTGGSTRNHEKTRLRKGCPILVSTPGRLLDHLQNTSSFNVSKCRWLVLDEADRLMELGFEETIEGIIKGLDGRRRMAVQAVQDGGGLGGEVGGWDWEIRRRTVLCSATIREDVQKLAGKALSRPLMIKGGLDSSSSLPATSEAAAATSTPEEKFTPPSQLSQKYIIVPLKLRLVALIALLRSLLSQTQNKAGKQGRGTKIIVFMSCTDSVDFHWKLLADAAMDREKNIEDATPDHLAKESKEEDDVDDDNEKPKKVHRPTEQIEVTSQLLPNTTIYRLHGSLAQQTRMASLKAFSSPKRSSSTPSDAPSSSILFCTSVASRGLDLPLVRAVIQYDLPTEGGATEYVHRVGRTARAGKGGEAWTLVAPSESEWIPWVEAQMSPDEAKEDEGEPKPKVKLQGVSVDTILKSGFGGIGKEYELRATEVQLSFERWVLDEKENGDAARKAFQSHMRAYATHPSNEKHMFHIRNLHLGHLAKAFALRDAPTKVNSTNISSNGASKKPVSAKTKSDKRKADKIAATTSQSPTKQQKLGAFSFKPKAPEAARQGQREWEEGHDGDAERRMQAVVRAQGKLTKKGGMMRSSGVSEFQIASAYGLEKLVHGSR